MIKRKHFKIYVVVYCIVFPLFIYDMYVRRSLNFTFVIATIGLITMSRSLKNQDEEKEQQNTQVK